LDKPVGRVKFAGQLYNGLYMLEGEENEDLKEKISAFKRKLSEHQRESPMKSFFSKDIQGTKRKSACTDGNEDAGTSAGGSGAVDHAVLRAHGYKVKPDVINGIEFKRLFEVRLAFSTYYMAL
jgi:hypothetical protein